jgi:predicted nucleotide-binding protein (sugar kinase/HSP70/actin superfamily)
VTSAETNRKTIRMGIDCVVAEPCFPIIVAHGHVLDLVERRVDYIWLPNILSAETRFKQVESHVCPWGQTLPFVIRQAPAFRSWQGRILCPTVRFREGVEQAREPLVAAAGQLGVHKSRANRAFDAAAAALQRFRSQYQQAGREALAVLDRTGEPGMVLVGRPYNVHDAGVSLSTARKLRENYGVNVIPIDAMPTADIDISDINDNMFWEYGRRILAAAKLVARRANLHIIYITNFKCGPDSFIKSFIRPASGKPFLTLQFDGHSNDAGMMTRCEAYLDSKGILRWWKKGMAEATAEVSKVEPSTSLRWPTPVRG